MERHVSIICAKTPLSGLVDLSLAPKCFTFLGFHLVNMCIYLY